MGEPYLTAKNSVSDLWFDIAGTLAQNIWQGYLNGFYKKNVKLDCTAKIAK